MSNPQYKVLQYVLSWSAQSGVTKWLMELIRANDPSLRQIDFIVPKNKIDDNPYINEIKSYGSRFWPINNVSRNRGFFQEIKAINETEGPYQILHGHSNHVAGHVVKAGERLNIPIRIVHAHNDMRHVYQSAKLLRRAYHTWSRSLIHRYATHGVGVSEFANVAVFGKDWRHDPRFSIIYHGIDQAPFRESIDRAEVRAEFGIPENAFVVGHVGRIAYQKNHPYIMEIIEATAKQKDNIWFLLAGGGDKQIEYENLMREKNLSDRVIFAGQRSDVPRLMVGAMDTFILPSLFEGLPLVVMEALSAGLPCFCSDTITPEVQIIPELVQLLPIDESPDKWAHQILALEKSRFRIPLDQAKKLVDEAGFTSKTSVRNQLAYFDQLIFDYKT